MSMLLTYDDLADEIQVRPSTVRRWAQQGIIPSLKLTGKVIRFDRDAVQKALREHGASQDMKGTPK